MNRITEAALLRRVNTLERLVKDLQGSHAKINGRMRIRVNGDTIYASKRSTTGNQIYANRVYMLDYDADEGNTLCSLSDYDEDEFKNGTKRLAVPVMSELGDGKDNGGNRLIVQLSGVQYVRVNQAISENAITVNSPLKVGSNGTLQYDDDGTETSFYSLEKPAADSNVVLVQFADTAIGTAVSPALITSKISGNHYAARLYPNGKFDNDGNERLFSSDYVEITVYILQIDETVTIPNCWLLVVKKGSHYEGQVPIWL